MTVSFRFRHLPIGTYGVTRQTPGRSVFPGNVISIVPCVSKQFPGCRSPHDGAAAGVSHKSPSGKKVGLQLVEGHIH